MIPFHVDDSVLIRQQLIEHKCYSISSIQELRTELEKCLDEHSIGCPNDKRPEQIALVDQIHKAIRWLEARERDYADLIVKMLRFFELVVEIKSLLQKQGTFLTYLYESYTVTFLQRTYWQHFLRSTVL